MNSTTLQLALRGMKAISIAERLAFQRKKIVNPASELLTKGYSYGPDSLADIDELEVQELDTRKSYFHRKILTENSINRFAENILSRQDIKDMLRESFGGQFCIGYISYYVTRALPSDLQDHSVYANHWHIDTLLSENAVKIMILPTPIEENQGPLQYFSQEDTIKITSGGFYRGDSIPTDHSGQVLANSFTGNISRALFIRSHSCMHTAGVPIDNNSREQIMIQLNPSKKWSYHTDLHERQYSKELTLPLLRNIFRSKQSTTA